MSALAPSMNTQQALPLPSPALFDAVVISARGSLRIEADRRVPGAEVAATDRLPYDRILSKVQQPDPLCAPL